MTQATFSMTPDFVPHAVIEELHRLVGELVVFFSYLI
jgi:hypothetical protein